MPFATLARPLACATRATVPFRLTPRSSSVFRFMSTQGESESSRPKSAYVTPIQTTAAAPGYQGRKPKKVYAHNSNGHLSDNSNLFVKPQDNPNLYRLFFRSPDKLGSLEEAQVFISHIKSNYGPLTQYQFSRCPETKRYFGYGFLTFKNEESINKALADGYIRVGKKDFELKRTGFIPVRRAVKHTNTGFNGFYDLDKLRAEKEAKRKREQSASLEGLADQEGQTKGEIVVPVVGSEFVSALSKGVSGTPTTTATPTAAAAAAEARASSKDQTVSGAGGESTSKPFFKPLQKKGHAQLWKTLPAEIERAEQDSRDNEDKDKDLQ